MKTLKQPTKFELLVDCFIESDWSLYIGGAIVGCVIIALFAEALL